MAEDPRSALAAQFVQFALPGTESVVVRRDVAYRQGGAGPLGLDVYLPAADAGGAQHPAVVFGFGFTSARAAAGLRSLGAYTSWARLFAASGIAAVAYSYEEPVVDLDAVMRFLGANGAALGIDGSRLGLCAFSGNAPVALHAAIQSPERLRCLALAYGYVLDAQGSHHVADAAAQFGFANPSAGEDVAALSRSVPLLVVRAGADAMPGLTAALDGFVARSLACDLPLQLLNLPRSPHAPDLADGGGATRVFVTTMLDFFRQHLETRSP